MSFPRRYFSVVIPFLLLCMADFSYAGWNIIKQLPARQQATCGFFFDATHGMIGTGYRRVSNNTPNIYLTSDGGTTWTPAVTPRFVSGAITSIMMKDAMIGYASFFSSAGDNNIWETVDGGVTWADQTVQNFGTATCIYATSKALVETTWGVAGGRSLNNGVAFNQIFRDAQSNSSNGIDFADDMNGIVTMGPSNNNTRSSSGCWFTKDGGMNWNEGDVLPEAWGVYSLKGTQSVFAMPEGYGSRANTSVYRSLDGGRSWNVIHDFTGADRHFFTGHIGGGHNTIYVQTDGTIPAGFYRTDDLGITWKNVGGPSNGRDTRFIVTGCNSETVYAFDSVGGVWKTTDGGDGTLNGSGGTGTSFSIQPDSLSISAFCSNARGYFKLSNTNCSGITIDSVTFSPDKYNEFSLDTTKTALDLFSNSTIGVPILFQSDSNIIRNTSVHIHAHSDSKIIDTIVVIRAQHSGITGPIMSLPFDSVYMETRYCQPLRHYIDLSNLNCSGLIIDTVVLSPQYPELTIDTAQNPNLLLAEFSSGRGIPVFFQTDSNLTRHSTMRIVGHSLDRKIDTTIILVAKHSTAPEPLLVTPAVTKIGDTVLIPIFLRATQDSFIIRHYAVHLSYDGDVLTPAKGIPYQDIGTLSRNASIKIGNPEPDGVLCTVDFTTPITQASDLSLPLIYLRMGVTLSRNLFSAIRLDTFSISNLDPLPLCTIPTTEFIVDPQCGDSSLSSYMRNGKILNLLSVHPNPNSGGEVEAEIQLSQPVIITAEFIDVAGKHVMNIFSEKSFQSGKHTLKIDTSLLSSGTYMLRMHAVNGEAAFEEIIIIR